MMNEIDTLRTSILGCENKARELEIIRDALAAEVSRLQRANVALDEIVKRQVRANERMRAERDALREALVGIDSAFADAIAAFGRRGKGGQEVPFHGAFANVLRMRWWRKVFSSVLASPSTPPEEPKP
jgi:hypothetical protein